MARPLRIEYPGAWYHVTCRGNERRAIFRDDRDRERFLEIIDETRELFGVEVQRFSNADRIIIGPVAAAHHSAAVTPFSCHSLHVFGFRLHCRLSCS
jgi:hypothetical protein